MIRRILAVLVIAAFVALVVVDRLAVSAAQRAIALKVRDAAQLGSTPLVSIHGFPFLTQAVRGKYHQIDVTGHGIHRGGVRIDTVHAAFFGVHVSLRSALAGKVSAVPIDRNTGDLLITYADLDSYLARRHLVVTPTGASLAVSGELSVSGAPVAASATYTPVLSGTTLVFAPVGSSLRLGGAAVSPGQQAAVRQALTLTVALGDKLPFGLQVRTLRVLATGLRIDAAATGLVVPVPDDASR